jgi:hypothetical protein
MSAFSPCQHDPLGRLPKAAMRGTGGSDGCFGWHWGLRAIEYRDICSRQLRWHRRLRTVQHSRENFYHFGRDGRLRAIQKRGLRRNWRLRAIKHGPQVVMSWRVGWGYARHQSENHKHKHYCSGCPVHRDLLFFGLGRVEARCHRTGPELIRRRVAGNAWQAKQESRQRANQAGNTSAATSGLRACRVCGRNVHPVVAAEKFHVVALVTRPLCRYHNGTPAVHTYIPSLPALAFFVES